MEPALGPPNADSARQAIHAIRGYEYQILAAALAWVDIEENGLIYLEIAEDYAHVVGGDIEAVQVKATRGSGTVTLTTPAVRDAIESFVDLVARNPTHKIHLRFLTTASIGRERSLGDQFCGLPGLVYWQQARAGRVNLDPLRTILEREPSPEPVRTFCRNRNDDELLADLVRRVTWDCDRPETPALRRELEERACLFLRREFRVPHQEALPFADVLASRVLHRSAKQDVQNRVLSRQELHWLAESSTRISLPRYDLERLLSKALQPPVTSAVGQAIGSARSLEYPPWIVDAAALPALKVLVRRERLEALVQLALSATGLCFVVGATGTGKSILARCVAATFPGPRYWIDLRDAEPSEARNRLKEVFVLLAEMGPATLMLEDLNCLAAPSVQVSLGEVVGAARRRDMRIVITSYGRPTATLLNTLGADSGSVVSSSHFDLKETCKLVSMLGGDPDIWGRVAHLTASAGHPQLTYAFVAGMAARGWPRHEIDEIVARGFTNPDLEKEHSAARTNLIYSLPGPTRELLYRISITVAPFDRSLAIVIGTIQPPVERAGECFDDLVDRWLEPAMADRYRPSPLVRGAARNMLTTAQQRRVHDEIATVMTSRNPIDAGDVDAILLHGLAGASQSSLLKLANAINLADDETRQAIARHLFVFPALGTSKPIYPTDLPTSVMLRLAQLQLVMATEERRGVDDIAGALLSEIDVVPDDLLRAHFEGTVLGAVLNNLGVARNLSNWVSLLSRFRSFVQKGNAGLVTNDLKLPPAAVLFNIGIAGLDSVKRLEAIFDDLSRLDNDERHEFLTPIDTSLKDYHILVHYPWAAQSRRPDFDAAEALDSYMKMCTQADSWGLRTLSIQCRIAIAVILDEYVGDTVRALRVLDDAVAMFGREVSLTRALAKLYRRIGQGTEALGYFRDVVYQMSMPVSINAVYTVREAAICAAECGEWNTACKWFIRAHAASEPLDAIGGLRPIGVGLRADAAVASFQAGDLRGALALLKDALLSLPKFEPDSSLQAAHCHRLIRHTILWLQTKIEGRDIKIEGQPIAMRPGDCSNPEPVPAIEQRPLSHIDIAWYMLAGIELTNCLDVGVREVVEQFGAEGYIPLSEYMFRTQILGATISAQNPMDFTLYFLDYLASATYCAANREAIRCSSSITDPEKVIIPALPHSGPYDSITEHSAQHAILAYGVRSLLVGEGDAIDQLCDSLRQEFGDSHPGSSLFDNLDAVSTDCNDLGREVARILRCFLMTERPSPYLIFRAGLRLLTWTAESPFKPVLIQHLKPWLTAHWERILQTQRFLLYSPRTTTPPIVEVLQSELEGEPFAASLTLVAEIAVRARLSAPLRQNLEHLVTYNQTPAEMDMHAVSELP